MLTRRAAQVQEPLPSIMGIGLRNEIGAGFAAFLDRQIEIWGRLIRENDIKPNSGRVSNSLSKW